MAKDRDPRISQIMATWDQLSRYKKNLVSLDELCAATGLEPGEFVGIAARAAFEDNGDVAMLQVSRAFPAVMEAAVQRACAPQGIRERRMFFEWAGFLPVRCRVVTVPLAPARGGA